VAQTEREGPSQDPKRHRSADLKLSF
jgi:hypothetical protein